MTNEEFSYVSGLEWMVAHLKDYEYFYWDILPQAPLYVREAYAQATGDGRFLDDDE